MIKVSEGEIEEKLKKACDYTLRLNLGKNLMMTALLHTSQTKKVRKGELKIASDAADDVDFSTTLHVTSEGEPVLEKVSL